MLWIGAPPWPCWVPQCVESYLRTGHVVSWWLYQKEERLEDLRHLRASPSGLLSRGALRLRDASEIVPYTVARHMFYHGMGEEGLWKGWAPFSDWFRYEVIARFGGWWVDADGVSVRNLASLTPQDAPSLRGSNALLFVTERHRLDRRKLGVCALPDPHDADRVNVRSQPRDAASAIAAGEKGTVAAPSFPSAKDRGIQEWGDWVSRVQESGLDLCLVTNSHFWAPAESPAMRELANDLRKRLEGYAQDVQARGPEAVKTGCSTIPNGNVGMVTFQRVALRILSAPQQPGRGSTVAAHRPRVLHWLAFNPVEATEAKRMHKVLAGAETLKGRCVYTVHIFRKVRDDWGELGLDVPRLEPQVSEEPPPKAVPAIRHKLRRPPKNSRRPSKGTPSPKFGSRRPRYASVTAVTMPAMVATTYQPPVWLDIDGRPELASEGVGSSSTTQALSGAEQILQCLEDDWDEAPSQPPSLERRRMRGKQQRTA